MKKHLFTLASVAMLAGVVSFSSCKKDDTTAPVITITGGNAQAVSLNSTYTAPAVTATDDVDGDITASISSTGTVDANTAGVYTVTYTVSDAAGNSASEVLTVTVANDAEFLAGTYAADDTCQLSWVSPYSMTWTASSTVNNKVSMGNLSNFGASVYVGANRSGNNLTFITPAVVSATGSVNSGSGTFTASGTTVSGTLTWQWTDGANTEVCTTTMSK